MASRVDIANMALGYVGDDPIPRIDDTTRRARTVSLYFNTARQRALRMGAWNCCSKRVELPKDATAPAFGFTNRYRLPGDFMRLICLIDASRDATYEIESGYILTDIDTPLKIKYVFDDTEVTRFDPLLTTVFAYSLATDINEALSEDRGKSQDLVKKAEYWFNRAAGVDGQERPPQELKHTSWLSARRRRS